jgi:hypothetical protein
MLFEPMLMMIIMVVLVGSEPFVPSSSLCASTLNSLSLQDRQRSSIDEHTLRTRKRTFIQVWDLSAHTTIVMPLFYVCAACVEY